MSLFLRSLKKSSPADFSFVFGPLVGTIELKARKPANSAYVHVTSLIDGRIAPISEFHLSFSPCAGDGDGSLEACLETWMTPLLTQMLELDTSIGAFELGSSEQRSDLAFAHMLLHQDLGNLGVREGNLNLRTARQYEVAKAFGIGTAVSLISKFETVGPTVITRRLTRARDAGLVEKLHNKNRQGRNLSDPKDIVMQNDKESDLH